MQKNCYKNCYVKISQLPYQKSDLTASLNGQKIDLITVYRSPETPAETDDRFVNDMTAYSFDRDLIVLGDFNLPHLFRRNPDRTSLAYERLWSDLGLFHRNFCPTRGENVLDLVLSSDNMLVSNCCVCDKFSSSDYESLKFDFNIFSGISFNQTVHKKYDFEKTDFAGFQDFLCTIDWTSFFSADDSVDGMWETFENFFQYGMYLYTPKRVPVSKKSAKWSAKTPKLYLRKKRFWHTYRRNRTRISRMLYNEASKEASDLDVFKREKRCLKSANIKQLYGNINSKLTSKNAMPPLILNSQIFETSENKANVLQDQFCSVFTRDDGNLPHFEKRTYEIFDKIELTDDVVLRAIKSFPGKISSGPDGIQSFLIKKLANSVLEPLKFIFNKSLAFPYRGAHPVDLTPIR